MPGGTLVNPVQAQHAQDVNNANIVAGAAEKYGVPKSILFGVWGLETDFGRNVTNSSTGAVGDFQFEPGTASSYNYPLTNSPSPAQFQAQADAAAHYLSDLYKQGGSSWNFAVMAYNAGPAGARAGHGYTLSDVLGKAGQSPVPAGQASGQFFNQQNPAVQGANTVGSTIGGIAGGIVSTGQFLSYLVDPKHWLRILMVIVGIIMLIIGFVFFLKQSKGGR